MREEKLNSLFNTATKKAKNLEGKWVYGYVWRGADHAYIIPQNLGVSIQDEGTPHKRISAPVEQVDEATICSPTYSCDRNGRTIYYGDRVTYAGEYWEVAFDDRYLCPILTRPLPRKNNAPFETKLTIDVARCCLVVGNIHNTFWLVQDGNQATLTVNGEFTDIKTELVMTAPHEIFAETLKVLIKKYNENNASV